MNKESPHQRRRRLLAKRREWLFKVIVLLGQLAALVARFWFADRE